MKNLHIDEIDTIVIDFDGVLTDNSVYLNHSGQEWVKCSRADGLAFDTLHKLNKTVLILSSETNKVVTARAKKLNVRVIQSMKNKIDAIDLITNNGSINLEKILYIGNDLNDLNIMKLCGYTACPSDSHLSIKKISKFVLKARGGDGVIREIVEDILSLDILEILYSN
jgi:YrbI family 3-deoxy-D-manno-octulosonate 8-phosphate phosphatase